MIRLSERDPLPELWQVFTAHKVDRQHIRKHLGTPTFIESDSSRTFGGEEDWWAFQAETGSIVAVILRVPYEDAAVCISEPSDRNAIEAVRALLAPWPTEFFDKPYRL